MFNHKVWSIAGSDCTGGAGIQADIKTIHNLGAEACSVITAVTAQNSSGVEEINAVSTEVLLSQLTALEQESLPQAIKIGLLANTAQVDTIAKAIARYKREWPSAPVIVYDPVAVASSGGHLTEEEILPVIKSKLLPLVDVLTPNNKEVQQLTGVYVFSWDCMEHAAAQLVKLGAKACVLKGGHIDIADGYSVDYGFDGQQDYWLASPKLDTEHTHGTGCTFASALASLLAQGYLLRDAMTLAKAYINQGLDKARDYPGCYGPVWQGHWPSDPTNFPRVLVPGSKLARTLDFEPERSRRLFPEFTTDFAKTDTDKLGLYPVVDSIDWLQKLLKLGVKTLQYREKHLQGDALEQAIQAAIQLGHEYKARLFINDHWQLAIKHQAYGVHLGQEDLADADLLAIKQAGLRLGISTHGHYELLKILEYRPSYLAVGAIFPTRTKDMTGQIQGLKTLGDLVPLCHDIPMVAIGGITLGRAESVLATGVGSIAVVTAITEADDYQAAVAGFNRIIETGA